MVRLTSARPSGGRPAVPAKMTSSILPPRRLLAPCSPITQLKASTTLDLPDPFGPTTQVMPGSRRSVVAEANDLKPRIVRVFRCTSGRSPPARHAQAAVERNPSAPPPGRARPESRGEDSTNRPGWVAGTAGVEGRAGVRTVHGRAAQRPRGRPRGGVGRPPAGAPPLGPAPRLGPQPGVRRRADDLVRVDAGPGDRGAGPGLHRPLVPVGRRRLRQDR